MIHGCYEHTLDKKNRVLIPAKIREEIGEDLYLITHFEDKCISIYSKNEWELIEEKLNELPNLVGAKLVRKIYAHLTILQADGQGRILLPQHLVNYAELEKDVTIIGAGKHAEIWNPEKLVQAEEEESSPENIEELKKLGF